MAERKFYTFDTPIWVSSSGYWMSLTEIPRGTSASERIASLIKLHSLTLNFSANPGNKYIIGNYRFDIVADLQLTWDSPIPTTTGYLRYPTTRSTRNTTYLERFTTLYSHFGTVTNTDVSALPLHKEMQLDLKGIPCYFNDAGPAPISKPNLWFFFITSLWDDQDLPNAGFTFCLEYSE